MTEQTQRVSIEPLGLTFRGDGVIDGTINARALGTAITAAADLVQAVAATEDFNEHAAPQLKIVASKEGSFDLQLLIEALGEWWAVVQPILSSDDAEAVTNLAGFATVALGAVKFLRDQGRRAIKSTKAESDCEVEATLSDGATLPTTPEALRAARQPQVQTAAKRLVSATQMPGIQNLEIHAENVNITVNVTGDQAKDFPEPDDAPPEADTATYEMYATFVRPDFGGNKWKVSGTRTTADMTIEDEDFLQKVDDGTVSLNKYSEFKVTVREEPYVTPGGQTRFHRSVVEVQESTDGAEARRALPREDGEEL